MLYFRTLGMAGSHGTPLSPEDCYHACYYTSGKMARSLQTVPGLRVVVCSFIACFVLQTTSHCVNSRLRLQGLLSRCSALLVAAVGGIRVCHLYSLCPAGGCCMYCCKKAGSCAGP